MTDTITGDDARKIISGAARARATRTAAEKTAPEGFGVAIAKAARLAGLPNMTMPVEGPRMADGRFYFGCNDEPIVLTAAPVFRCVGGCGEEVPTRGAWCPGCAEKSLETVANMRLEAARESISPEGARDWCTPGNAAYAKATKKALALLARVGDKTHAAVMRELFTGAQWSPRIGNILLLGPTGIGKSKILAAMGLALIATARRSRDPAALDFAAGVTWVSGLELARERARHPLGGEDPPLVRRAKRASLLLIDEIGFEEDRLDPHAVRDVLRYRYEPQQRFVIVASGATRAQLDDRYGEPTVRMVWDHGDRGHLVDLHLAEKESHR